MPALGDRKPSVALCRERGYGMSSCLGLWMSSAEGDGYANHDPNAVLSWSAKSQLVTAICTISLVVYVGLVVYLVGKQFRRLESVQEDNKQILVSDSQGKTDLQTYRCLKDGDNGTYL